MSLGIHRKAYCRKPTTGRGKLKIAEEQRELLAYDFSKSDWLQNSWKFGSGSSWNVSRLNVWWMRAKTIKLYFIKHQYLF